LQPSEFTTFEQFKEQAKLSRSK